MSDALEIALYMFVGAGSTFGWIAMWALLKERSQ